METSPGNTVTISRSGGVFRCTNEGCKFKGADTASISVRILGHELLLVLNSLLVTYEVMRQTFLSTTLSAAILPTRTLSTKILPSTAVPTTTLSIIPAAILHFLPDESTNSFDIPPNHP